MEKKKRRAVRRCRHAWRSRSPIYIQLFLSTRNVSILDIITSILFAMSRPTENIPNKLVAMAFGSSIKASMHLNLHRQNEMQQECRENYVEKNKNKKREGEKKIHEKVKNWKKKED